jgi:hypothetical protein
MSRRNKPSPASRVELPAENAATTTKENDMTTTRTARITAALAGFSATAGIFAGILVGTAAEATAAPMGGQCTQSAQVTHPSTDRLNPLTRVWQVQGNMPAPKAPVSCLSH